MTVLAREWVAMEALIAGMEVVRRYQIGGISLGKIETKPDDTIVTACDRESQQAIFNRIGELLPNAILIGEEKTTYASPLNIQPDEGQDGWLVDPLDGTSALGQGLPTSTVIIANRKDHEVVGCVIGEPISGRTWNTLPGNPCYYNHLEPISDTIDHTPSRKVRVWDGQLAPRKTTVYIDVSHAWENAGITQDHQDRLSCGLASVTNVLRPGSNGLMQALVANGGRGMAGSITTAKGGPWDLCGVLLVLSAGGYACGLAKSENGWVETNALNVDETECLICANNQDTLATLRQIFLESMS